MNNFAPHELSVNETRRLFLQHIWKLIESSDRTQTSLSPRENLERLAFNILTALDGEAVGLPAWILAPLPHPDDREYHLNHDQNWYAENSSDTVKCNIAGELHELFVACRP